MNNLIKDFADVVKRTGGYASHLTALFFLGHLQEMPGELSIICTKRLANKVLLGKTIRMIFAQDLSEKNTNFCKIGISKLRVSTVEQTLVDLAASRIGDLSYLAIGKLFLTLNYDLKQLIQIAENEGDTSLKRVLFYTIWTGRADWHDFPGILKRMPVKLFATLEDETSCWNRHLFIRFPIEALHFFPVVEPSDLPQLPSKVVKRIFLARYQPFRDYFAREKILPVFDLPALSGLFSGFFNEFLEGVRKDPQTVFAQVAGSGSEYPDMIIEWLENQAAKNKLPDWFINEAGDWIRLKLGQKTIENVVLAVELAIRLQLHALVLPHLPFINEVLTEARRFEQIDKLCELAWKKGELKTFDEILIYLSAMVMISKSHDALQMIADIRSSNPQIPEYISSELSYYAARSFLNINKFADSMREIEACKIFYERSSNSQRLIGLELVASNIFLVNGQLKEAKNRVLNAYQIAKSAAIGKTMVSATLSNLTQIEYICGHFLSSIQFARQTLRKIPAMEATNTRFTIKRMLLSASIGIGDLPKALVYGKQLLKIGNTIGSESRILVSKLMLAHVYELYGQPATAGKIWKLWDESCILEKYPFLFPTFVQVKTARLVLNGAITEAMSLLSMAEEKMTGGQGTSEPKQFLLHQLIIKGLLQAKINDKIACCTFEKASQIAKTMDDCYEKALLHVVVGCLFPWLTSNGDLVANLKALVKEQAHDPFWFLYANNLYQREIPEGTKYLQAHVEKTHQGLLNNYKLRYPLLKKLISKLWKKSNERRVLMAQSGKTSLVSLQEFNSLTGEPNRLLFDVVSGEWSLYGRNGIVRPGTNAHKIVSALLVIKGNRIHLKDMYECVWGGKFDPETDKSVVLAALIRSRKILHDISPAICLEWGKGKNAGMEISLKIKIGWAALL